MVVGGINISTPTPALTPNLTGITLYESAFFVLCFLQKQRLKKNNKKKQAFMAGLCCIVINDPSHWHTTGRGWVAWLNFIVTGKCGG